MDVSWEQQVELRDALDAAYAVGTGRVGDFRQNTNAADAVIFSFRYDSPDARATTGEADRVWHADLIMRLYERDHADDAWRRAEWEFAVLESLHNSEISVPRPICLVNSQCGPPYFVMERVVGRSMGASLLEPASDPGRADEAGNVLFQFVNKMVQIHAIPLESLTIPGGSEDLEGLRLDPKQAIFGMLKRPHEIIARFDLCELRPVLRWLDEGTEELTDLSIVWTHGDFHPDNILIDSDGELYVIDWSNIRLSDFRVDIGFAIGVMNAFGEDADFSDRLTGLYQQISGRTVTRIDFFLLLSNFYNILRLYSVLNDFQITGENEATRRIMLNDYQAYCRMLHSIVKDVTGYSIPSVETFVRGTRR